MPTERLTERLAHRLEYAGNALRSLESMYLACAAAGSPSKRLILQTNLFLELLSHTLDQAMNYAWELVPDKTIDHRPNIYFPAKKKEQDLRAVLKLYGLDRIETAHPDLFAIIESAQLYKTGMKTFFDVKRVANLKHVREASQSRRVDLKSFQIRGSGHIAEIKVWSDGQIEARGKSADPNNPLIVQAQVETKFIIEEIGRDVLEICSEGLALTRQIIEQLDGALEPLYG